MKRWRREPCAWSRRHCDSSAGLSDDNSCTVNALANASGMSWKLAYEILRLAGRQDGKGFPIWRILSCGLPLKGKVPIREVEIGRFLRRHPVGRFVCATKHHAFAVVNGTVLDWIDETNPILLYLQFDIDEDRLLSYFSRQ